MKVREALRKPPIMVERTTPMSEVAKRMDASSVGAVVVVHDGLPIGIVTDRDLVVRGLANELPADTRIDAFMSTSLETIDAGADLRDALKIFERHAIRRIPVVDDGTVVGVLALDDLVIDLVSDLAMLVRPVVGEVIFGHAEGRIPQEV